MQRKKECPEVVFEIFTVKHKHVNNLLSKNKRKPFFYEKIRNFPDNQAFGFIFPQNLNYTSFFRYKILKLKKVCSWYIFRIPQKVIGPEQNSHLKLKICMILMVRR